MLENPPLVIKHLERIYDISTDVERIYPKKGNKSLVSIIIYLIFKPKEYNRLTPEPVTIFAQFKYDGDKLIRSVFTHPTSVDIPILAYYGSEEEINSYLDSVFNKLGKDEYNRLKEEGI